MTASSHEIIITLDRAALAKCQSAAAAELLVAFAGDGHGDWGGVDYPEIAFDERRAEALIQGALDAIRARRGS